MTRYLMKCGHVAMAHNTETGAPCCVMCGCETIDREVRDAEGLEGRIAVCSCGSRRASKWSLPFFDYRPDKKTDEFYCGCDGWE